MGYTVKSVEIRGRWVPADLRAKLEAMVGIGRLFEPANLNLAMKFLREEIVSSENLFAIRLVGSTSVLYIESEVCDVSDSAHPKQAQITISPYYLRIDLFNLGRNLLPIPRTARPSFFREVPSFLLASAPVVGFTNDREYGPAIFLLTSTDLLQVSEIKTSNKARPIRLNADVEIRKSLNNPFHSVGMSLNLAKPVYADTTIGWSLGIGYANQQLPLGKDRYDRQLFRAYGSLQASSNISLLRRYSFGGAARFLKNQYNVYPSQKFDYPENGFEVFALSDGRISKGFSRIGIWFDAANPKDADSIPDVSSYQRLSGRFGYAFVIGNGHQTVDVETSIGAGYSWGSPPPYHRYFAGNAATNFLHVPFTSRQVMAGGDGPVVRSLGEREAGPVNNLGATTGGTAYWNFNLSFALPIRAWARPLIPDIVISEEPRRITLRSALKGTASMAKTFILNDLIDNHGFPDNEETEEVAERMVGQDIRPTLNYFADRANLFSIKPIILFDVARIDDREFADETWVSAGIGIQLTLVVAKLDIGYMRTLAPSADEGKGNLILRFTVQNFY